MVILSLSNYAAWQNETSNSTVGLSPMPRGACNILYIPNISYPAQLMKLMFALTTVNPDFVLLLVFTLDKFLLYSLESDTGSCQPHDISMTSHLKYFASPNV